MNIEYLELLSKTAEEYTKAKRLPPSIQNRQVLNQAINDEWAARLDAQKLGIPDHQIKMAIKEGERRVR